MLLFDDGICRICKTVNAADPGKKPVIKLAEVDRFYYGEDSVFYKRFYAAKAAGTTLDKMIHVEGHNGITGDHIAVLEDGLQYRVAQAQPGHDKDGLEATWLSLSRMEESYEFA